MYKLLALDVDGTILTSRRRIAPETTQAVQRAIAAGVHVTLATGRAFPSAVAIGRELGLQDPLVTHDGAYVADPATGRVLYEERVPPEVAARAAEIARSCDVHLNVLHEKFTVTDQWIRQFRWTWFKPANWSQMRNVWRESRHYPHVFAADLPQYLREHQVAPPKFYVTGAAAGVSRCKEMLAAQLGTSLRCTSAGHEAMEVIPLQVSKASGIRLLAAALGVRQEEVVAVGDSYNDVEMITQAGLGVAMGNAPDDIKRMAGFVTRTNDEHGVAHVVERFFG